MFADHLASRRSDQVLEPDPRLGEDGLPLAKEKTADEAEDLRLKGASRTVPVQSSSGKNMGEDGSSLVTEKIVNEAEELHLEEASRTVPAQSSSGKNMGEDGSSLTKKKTANELGELHIEGSSWTVPAQSSSGKKMGESKTGTTSYTERKILFTLILYDSKGFTLPHDVVPCPVPKEHVSICVLYIWCLIYSLILLFAVVVRILHLTLC